GAAPSSLQETGAFISQGGTNQAKSSLTLLTTLASLTPLLAPALPIATAVWSGNLVTITITAGHGIPAGETINGVISGVSPGGYNGTFACTYVNTTQFTYPLGVNPGLATTTVATFIFESQVELLAMATTFFAQGSGLSVYVLELGIGNPADGVNTLTTFIGNPTVPIYSYLLPREWATQTTAVTLAKNNSSTTSKMYFWFTTPFTSMPTFYNIKSIVFWVEASAASGIPVTELSAAADFWHTLDYSPSPSN